MTIAVKMLNDHIKKISETNTPVSYTHLRAHETLS
jgi:hypothetical protein